MPMLSANGETLHYLKEGAGPAVALIHSLGSSVHMWRSLIAALKDRYTVVACDLRGHGGSSAKGECSVPAAAADLKAVLDHLGIVHCHLVGASTGAAVALTLAAQSPALVRTLVLAGACARPLAGSKERVEATAEAVAYVSMEEFGTQYAAETLLPSTSLDVQDELAAIIAKVHPKAYMQLMRSAVLGDFTELLAAVAASTLILAGERDAIVPRAEADFTAAQVPGAVVEVVPEAGHLACLDNPAVFADAVARFLDRQR
ncbi:MAG: alpha/beta fold hydrolase [Hyphomicrobiales bacterium]|nr:alpha/beta fold hydrolase [Hyphomicrobiales bacterium]